MIWIAGVLMPNPSDIKPGEFDVGYFDRMADASMSIDIIATKQRWDVTWDKITDSELALILNTIKAHKPFFPFRHPAPGGDVTTICYAGDRNYGYWRTIGGIRYWKDISIAFIEQ